MSLASIERYDEHRVRRLGGHAVVLGASVAGLLAARVLADAYDQVTIVERDPLDDETGARRGVPQGRHPHVLLLAGQAIMEELEPGYADELVASGALRIDLSHGFNVHVAGDFLAGGVSGLPMYFASRSLIERVLRTRVASHERVSLCSDHQVTGPLSSEDGGALEGVIATCDGSQRELPADLIVDATGRRSLTEDWLERFGYALPERETVQVDLAYRTCQIRRPPDDRRAMLVMPSPPRKRGASVAPVEDDRWLVTLFGMHGDHPPSDLEGLREFAATLPISAIHDVLANHEPVTSDVARYRFPTNLRHRYDQLDDVPHNLLWVGDAVASFNPIYGQGMSVAALEALALHHTLADHGTDGLARGFYATTGRIVDAAWNMAAGGDFQFPETHGAKPPATDVLNRYITRLHRRSHGNRQLADEFFRVVVMERSPTSLFHPRVAWRVLGPSGRSTRSSSSRVAS